MDRNLRRNTLILIGSLAVILAVYVVAYWLPQRRQTASIRNEIAEKRTSIQTHLEQGKQLAELKREIGALQSYTHQIEQRIPPALNFSEFLATVYGLSQSRAVTIQNVRPGIAGDLVGVQQQTVSLTLVGRFHSIVQLIYELESLDRMIDVTDVDARTLNAPGAFDVLEVKLDLRLFARPAKPSQPAQRNS